MARRTASPRDRGRGFLLLGALVGVLLALLLVAAAAQAGDVASAEAHGELGLGASQPEAAVSEAPEVVAGEGPLIPGLETLVYLLAASWIFAGYALASRKWPWLRGRHRNS